MSISVEQYEKSKFKNKNYRSKLKNARAPIMEKNAKKTLGVILTVLLLVPTVLSVAGFYKGFISEVLWMCVLYFPIDIGTEGKSWIKQRFLKNSLICVFLFELLVLLSFVVIPVICLQGMLINMGIVFWLLHALAVWVCLVIGVVMSPKTEPEKTDSSTKS